jgi:hypothetical protein
VFRLKRQIRLDQLRLMQTFKISTIHPNRESRSRPRRKGVGNYKPLPLHRVLPRK